MEPKMQRFCWFDTVPANNTIWKYKRAIEGHKMILAGWTVMMESTNSPIDVFHQIYDGHTYTHWGSFPNIFDQATLDAFESNSQSGYSHRGSLYNFELKEFTLSARNEIAVGYRFLVIVFFYEIPMTKLETLEYATKQPRYKYRHGSARTLDRFED